MIAQHLMKSLYSVYKLIIMCIMTTRQILQSYVLLINPVLPRQYCWRSVVMLNESCSSYKLKKTVLNVGRVQQCVGV